MKAILMSIRPKWVAKILNGDKTAEIRKGMSLKKAVNKLIAQYGEATIYIYCTKGKEKLYDDYPNVFGGRYHVSKNYILNRYMNGKVVAKFVCRKVEEIKFTETEWCGTEEIPALQVLDKSCLSYEEITTYLKDKNGNGFVIHISDFEIFDEPKELSEFGHIVVKQNYNNYGCKTYKEYFKKPLTKAPQSFCYVEVYE